MMASRVPGISVGGSERRENEDRRGGVPPTLLLQLLSTAFNSTVTPAPLLDQPCDLSKSISALKDLQPKLSG